MKVPSPWEVIPPQIIRGTLGTGGVGSTIVVARVATSNLALTGTISVDGSNATNATLVLATAQTTPSQNGVWTVNTAGAWTKGPTFQPTLCLVSSGTSYAKTSWFLSAANTYTACVGVYA